MQFYLASQNQHKAEEFSAAVTAVQINPAPISLDVDENADSFIGNAQIKARAYAEALHANAIADDSGLCVDALGGAPGIHSARYAILPPDPDHDPDRTAANNRKLLRALIDIPDDKRSAHFTCALCLVICVPEDIRTMRRNKNAAPYLKYYDAEGRETDADSDNISRAEIAFQAEAPGRILNEIHGCGGFGYDPLFYCPETGCTFAELTREQKLAVSHRGRAIARLKTLF